MIAASSFQLEEAEGYRHSRDKTSRDRVREALNAALKALPEWPEPLQTTRGGVAMDNVQPPLQVMMPAQPQLFQQPYQPVRQPDLQPSFTGVPAQYWQQPTFGFPR